MNVPLINQGNTLMVANNIVELAKTISEKYKDGMKSNTKAALNAIDCSGVTVNASLGGCIFGDNLTELSKDIHRNHLNIPLATLQHIRNELRGILKDGF